MKGTGIFFIVIVSLTLSVSFTPLIYAALGSVPEVGGVPNIVDDLIPGFFPGEKEPIPEPVPDPIEEIIPEGFEGADETDTRQEVSREQIDNQKRELADLRIKLNDLTQDRTLKEAEILSLESKYNLAEKKYKDDKIDDNETAMNTAEQNFIGAKNELIVINDQIRDTNNKILSLEKTVINTKAKFSSDKSKKSPKTIGIVLSGTCLTMLKAQIENTKCPSYEFIMALNLDTSDYRSGSFGWDENTVYTRGDPLVQNDHLLYDFNDYNVIVDPSATTVTRIATITISPNLGVYTLAADMNKIDNKRVLHTDRYVEDCYRATITADTWLNTIDDTLFFMRNGCEGYLGGTVIEVEDPVTETNIAESSKWKYDEWLANIDTTQNLIGKNMTVTNPSVIEDED